MSVRPEPRPPATVLEENLEWIRSMARTLARDAETADELAQEACVVALEQAPREARGFRPWLATVMRNLLRQRGRSEGRRIAREEFAGGARDPDPGDLVQRVIVFRELAAQVLELDEPYRAAILMRFFEGLPPRAIARKLGSSPATIQNRITRGLALLRERLDRAHGGRASWLGALLPALGSPSPLATLTLGGMIVNAKLLIALVLVAATGTIVALTQLSERGETPVDARTLTAESPAATPLAPLVEEPRGTGVGPGGSRESALPAAANPAQTDPAASALHSVRGRVLDAGGAPLSGIAVRTGEQGEPAGKSGNGGWFEFTSPSENLQVLCADPAWTSVRSANWRQGSQLEPLLIVARATNASGSVSDEHGNPLAEARVRYVLPAGFEARFDRPLEASLDRGWATSSDAAGHFALPGLPAIEGARLVAVLEGFAQAECSAPLLPDAGIAFVLARPKQPLTGGLRGRVVDERGSAVPGARVFLGLASTSTDEQGRFALDFARAVSSERLVALKAGWRMGVLERPREPRANESGWPESVEVALPGPVLAIRGEVLDKQGKPVPGLRVSLAHPTLVGRIGQMPVHAEFLAAGAPVPPQALESENSLPEQDGNHFNDWLMPVGPATAFYNYVTTDADGRFELGGLDDKKYGLTLQDSKTCSHFVPDEEFRAGGAPVRIEWQAPALLARVAGVILNDNEEPVAGARLMLVREAFGTRTRVFGGEVLVSLRDRTQKSKSGAEGQFEFTDVPAEGMKIGVAGEGIVPDEFAIARSGDKQALKLVVFQRCPFEVVQVSNEPAYDAISLRDGKDAGLDVLRIDEQHTNAYTEAPLVDGRSGVLSASSAARSIVLLRGGQPVKTIAIRLRPGEVNRFEI